MTSQEFQNSFFEVIGVEGGYSDDPSDSGGKTRYGITEYLARNYGYKGNMSELPLEKAREIYYDAFWYKMNLDEIARLSPKIACELFDTGVNMGTARAVEFLQKSLNVFNNCGSYYPDIAVDGVIGPATISALRAFIHKRGQNGEQAMLKALNSLQGAYYIDLALQRQKDERFVYGWMKRVKL